MRKKLESAAKAGNRSLHAEIMMRLEKSLSTQTVSLLSIAPPSMEPVLQMRKDIRDLNKRMKDMLETIKKSYHQPINYNNGLKLLRKPLNSQEKMLYSSRLKLKNPQLTHP